MNVMPRWLAKNGWTAWHAAGVVALGALGVAATWDACADIFLRAWRDEEMSHILLVPLVMAWLVWVRRGRLRACRPRRTMVGPIVIGLGWLLYSGGDHLLIQSAWHLGALVIVLGCVLSVLGWHVLWRFLPVVLAIGFMVPVPGTIRQQIALPMQNAAAVATEHLLGLFGTAVQRSGNLLSVNGVDITIAEACNGLRMVFALTLVSYAFAFGTPLRGYVRLAILAASPLLALGTNVLRLSVAVWLYGHYTADLGQWYHDVSGWLMLPVLFLALLGVIRVLRWALIPVAPYSLAYD